MNRYNRSNTRPVLLWYCGKLQFLRVRKKNLMVTPPHEYYPFIFPFISSYLDLEFAEDDFVLSHWLTHFFFSNLSKSKWWFLPHDLILVVQSGLLLGITIVVTSISWDMGPLLHQRPLHPLMKWNCTHSILQVLFHVPYFYIIYIHNILSIKYNVIQYYII